jgi:hypothetical protein
MSNDRAVSRPGDRSEEEADRATAQVMRALSSPVFEEKQEAPALSQSPPLIQREGANVNAAETGAVAETTPAPETAAPSETSAAGLIVEDDAQGAGPGQMRKSEFLNELRVAVCAEADAELTAAGRSTEGCPYIERAFERYRAMSGAQLELRLRRYAPEAAEATTARDYIPAVSRRVRRAVAVWATTGQITGAPEELESELPEAGLFGAFGGLLSGIGGAISSLVGGIGGIFFKAQGDGAKDADPRAIQSQLGSGHSLDGGVKSRMESAFGYDFSHVRVHTDGKAANLSTELSARAFTIGSDVAFGAEEYRPGTPVGDALLAHELAHVVQQGGVTALSATFEKGETSRDVLEEDADKSAVGAVVSLWGGTKGTLAAGAESASPSLRSRLRLQRCSPGKPQSPTPQAPGAEGKPAATGEPDPCGGTSKAATYVPTTEGAKPTLDSDEFGRTSKLGAYFDFGACKVGASWRFYLTSLRVPIDSAVKPEDFRINVESASSSVVTSASYPEIISDLRPERQVTFQVSCGRDRYEDQVSTYSRRRRYWKHKLVVDHEASHRTDWDNFYRAELLKAEKNIWAHAIPVTEATTDKAAVQKEKSTLTAIMADAYRPTCQAYAPKQESRAYDKGAPAYQQLVDDIKARAEREGWVRK